jgi:hypothetical protein
LTGIGVLLCGVLALNAAPPVHPLKVSANKRYLVDQNNNPAFFVADTRWAIFSFPGKSDVIYYLNKRQEQKFNALLVHMLPWKDSSYKTARGTSDYSTSPAGEFPFVNDDFTKPNEKYWSYVDEILAECATRGFIMFMVPVWLNNWSTLITKSGYAKAYGEFVGNRYKSYKNKVYLMGGDKGPSATEKSAYDALAKAIRSKDPAVLLSFHPLGNGHSSSEWVNDYGWMDFHSVQTTNDDKDNYTLIEKDYALTPTRPTWLVEPGYENQDDRATPFTIRRCGYWSVFSGGFGYGYGNYPLWNAGAPPEQRGWDANWKAEMATNGAKSMQYLLGLMNDIPWYECSPLNRAEVLQGTHSADIRLLSKDNFAAIYVPMSEAVKVKMSYFKNNKIEATWYDPTNGTSKTIAGSPFANSGEQSFQTPGNNSFKDPDWVLLLKASGSTDVKDDALLRSQGTPSALSAAALEPTFDLQGRSVVVPPLGAHLAPGVYFCTASTAPQAHYLVRQESFQGTSR